MNVFLFFQLGLTLSNALPWKWGRWGRIILTTFVGCMLSAGIEYAQYRYALGMAEVHDVICNTLGGPRVPLEHEFSISPEPQFPTAAPGFVKLAEECIERMRRYSLMDENTRRIDMFIPNFLMIAARIQGGFAAALENESAVAYQDYHEIPDSLKGCEVSEIKAMDGTIHIVLRRRAIRLNAAFDRWAGKTLEAVRVISGSFCAFYAAMPQSHCIISVFTICGVCRGPGCMRPAGMGGKWADFL